MHSDTFTAAARQNFQTDAIFKSNDLHYNGSIRESIKSKGDKPMELMEAIYKRRSVRFFTEEKVDKDVIDTLLNAAVQAPSAMNNQPWAFGVIQDKELMKKISDDSKAYLLAGIGSKPFLEAYRQLFSNPDYNIFYNAPVLLTVFARPEGPNPAVDCALAAQNIMLAAHALGLGTCWIGFAQMSFNLPELKELLGIPKEYSAVAPIILGHPAKASPEIVKKDPEILFRK